MTKTRSESASYAHVIDNAVRVPQTTLRDSTLGHQDALDELLQIWSDCREPNWDGYDALPVEKRTWEATYLLIDSLPLGFPRPSLGAEPDGQLTLEWRTSARRTLSVSVDPDGYLHYAGLFGLGKRYGTLPFFNTAPDELIQLVRDL